METIFFNKENIITKRISQYHKNLSYTPNNNVKLVNKIGIKKITIHYCKNDIDCYILVNEKGKNIFNLFNKTVKDDSYWSYINECGGYYICSRLGYTKHIERIGKNDFIFENVYGDFHPARLSLLGSEQHTEYRHVKIIDNVPTEREIEIRHYEKTDIPNLVIINDGLYDVEKETFVDRCYSSLHYLGNQEFIVKDIISTLKKGENGESINKDTAEYDYFHFRINEKGERITEILSELDATIYPTKPNTSYEDIKERRRQELMDRENRIIEEIIKLNKRKN